MRSSTPPCPGISAPVSFRPTVRLMTDSARSPTCPTSPSKPPAATAAGSPQAGSSQAPSATAVATEAITWATEPSTVLRGLMTGASGCRPSVEPTR